MFHPLARAAHAVALDRLGQDDRRSALVFGRRLIGRVHFERVVAAAIERPNFVVGETLDERARLRIPSEKVLAHVVAVTRS